MSLHTSFPAPTWEQSFAAGQFLQQPMLLPTKLAKVSWPGDCREEQKLLPCPLLFPLVQRKKQRCPFTKAFSKPTSILTTPRLYMPLNGTASPNSHTDTPLCTIFLSTYLKEVLP